jgi:colanic acid/amylovoran biosynthesis glycosyltransferase
LRSVAGAPNERDGSMSILTEGHHTSVSNESDENKHAGQSAFGKSNLIIYRDELLDGSETFILSQAESLTAFTPFYVGTQKLPGLELPKNRCLFLPSSRYRRFIGARVKLAMFDLMRLRALHPALIHAHFAMDADVAIPLVRALGTPLLVTVHGWDATVRDDVFRRHSIALHRYVGRRAEVARLAARVVCTSEFVRRQVHKKGFSPDKTVVHYIGVDLRKFVPNPAVERKPIVLFAGRLVEEKGCHYLIRAMEKVQSYVPGVEMVVLGDGPLRFQLEREARSRLRSFHFAGWCPPATVRDWMNKARVFCTPSIVSQAGDTETFGMVFAEAQAMGLPVASFAIGGIPEAVEHGVTGLLAPERDTNALAQNILTLLTNHSMWRQFSFAGHDRVKRLFDLEKQTSKLEQIYHSVIQEHQAAVAAS